MVVMRMLGGFRVVDRLHDLFCQARELTGRHRRAYLEHECGDDVELLDEVLQLLANDNSSLFSIPDEPAARVDDVAEPPQIEGYRIHELLGQGGMGHVWHATQLSTRREVALKVLPAPGLCSVVARNQFHREAELAARIAHPNVAQIYDCGIGSGCAFTRWNWSMVSTWRPTSSRLVCRSVRSCS